MRTQAGFFMPETFSKPAISLDDQVALLQSRGLLIEDEARAKHYLRHIGYYRLSGYSLVFQVGYNSDGHHRFHPDASFDAILDLYVFDRKLRLHMLDALERIEVAARAAISHEMCALHGSHWFMDVAHFFDHSRHSKFLNVVKKDLGHGQGNANMADTRQVFIQHYYTKYDQPELPPSWMVFEVLSFGAVSQVFNNLTRQNQKPVARSFGLDPSIFSSWLHAVSYTRNLVAHHARLWNKTFTITPIAAKTLAAEMQPNNKLYAQAIVCQALLDVIAPGSHWATRLADLMEEHPKVPLAKMGFPEGWKTRSIWAKHFASGSPV